VAIFNLGADAAAAKPVSKAAPAKSRPQTKVKQAAKAYLSEGNAALDWTEF